VFYFFNERWINSLPSDLRELVFQAAADAAEYQAVIDDVDQERALQAMRDGGLNVIQPRDIDAWMAATAPMVDQFRARGPEWADFISRIMAIP
jgi:TRAP-type C4-dicarboxylate transport system substrate-binding protein